MKIRALRLEHFKKFDEAVEVVGFGDGLNLIEGPNETGKSTLLLALRAVLFERHGSKAQAVKDLSPHRVSGARPTVTLDFEIDDQRYHLEKSFLRRPAAYLEVPDNLRFEGSDAEAELKRLLGLGTSEKNPIDKDSPAHFGVMLTPQTQSFALPTLVDATRHTLEAAVTREIDDLGHQGEVDGLLATLRQEHGIFIDGRGKPKGRYKDVLAKLQALDREIDDLGQKRDLLHQDVEALNQAIARRDELSSAEDGEALANRLSALEDSRARAVRRQDLDNQRLAVMHQRQNLLAERTAIEGRLAERQRLSAETAEISQTLTTASETLATVEQDLAERERAAAILHEQEHGLARKKRRLETLGQQIERRGQIAATLAALATEVRFDLDDGAFDRLTVDGDPPDRTPCTLQVTEGLSIAIEGIGRIAIEPKIEPMRDALAARDRIEAAIEELLGGLDLTDSEPEAIEQRWQDVAAEIERVTAERAALEMALSEARKQAAEAKAKAAALQDQQRQLEDRLGQLNETSEDDSRDAARLEALASEIAAAESDLDQAEARLRSTDMAETRNSAFTSPLDQLEAEIKHLARQIDERGKRLDDVSKTILRLEAAIGVRAGLGLDEQIDQLGRQRHLLAQERDAFALDHDALALLQTTLRDVAAEAKATFNAPLAKRLVPYIQDLLPEATPLVAPDFSIRALNRDGVEEPFSHLSDGTREQIAVLARLAFADMLQEQGLPALVVLDDALAFSDRDRLERMVDMLQRAAERMQVIILTCRADRFAAVEATRLHITPAPENASSAA